MIQPTIFKFHSNKYSQQFHYYPFLIKLDRCAGSFNNINDLSNKVCVPNKTENLNLSVFNMITGKNGKHQQSIYHANANVDLMEENVIQINGGVMISVNMNAKNVRLCLESCNM